MLQGFFMLLFKQGIALYSWLCVDTGTGLYQADAP